MAADSTHSDSAGYNATATATATATALVAQD